MMRRRPRLGTGPRDRRGVAFHGRFLAVVLLVVLCFGTLVARLGQVQLVGHADYAAASSLDTRTLTEPAMRGRILDAQGLPLADNRASTVVTIERRVIVGSRDRAESVVREVARVLGLPPEHLLARTWLCGEEGAPAAPACWAGSPQVPVPLAEDVDATRALTLVERPDRFPGIAVESRPVRVYPRPLGTSAAQLIGYLGQVRADEVGPATGLTADDLVGRAGLEEQYDDVLRGTPGRTVVSVDPRGLVTGVVSRTAPVNGRDLVTSIDARVQATAEQALAAQIAAARKRGWAADSGAVVVLDPRTGAVAALASAPTYDPNLWTGGISEADYATLTSPAAGTPLLSRAIGYATAPASTLKPASVTASVAAGNPLHGRYDCPSSYRIGNRVFNNHETKGRGLISFATAIQISCDTVFYKTAYDAWRAQGGITAATDAPDPFASVAKGFGLGTRTGIDLPGEAAGRVPDRTTKKAYWEATKDELCGRARTGYPEVADTKHAAYLQAVAVENCADGYLVRPGDVANFSIGQGDVATTPLQVAVMYAAIANGGTVLTPRVGAASADPVTGARSDIAAGPTRKAPVSAELDSYLRGALRSAVTDGSTRWLFRTMTDWPVAGKTGTGEVVGKRDTSWFVSYAPANTPRWVVSVVVSQGGPGARTAGPVAKSVHETLRSIR
ncbi:penicillin-binding protein 2 [Oryzobacter telluris]|uniref:penicillin-binding protein 2 n=1 Tax=Oryzobacter telluris TaxID=3149179 RepID=UPI00370DAA1C